MLYPLGGVLTGGQATAFCTHGDALEYEVEGIMRHQGKRSRRRYLVLWKGYPLHEATWEPESHLANAPNV